MTRVKQHRITIYKKIFIDIILPAALWSWRWLSL